jgi:hypothetical protein
LTLDFILLTLCVPGKKASGTLAALGLGAPGYNPSPRVREFPRLFFRRGSFKNLEFSVEVLRACR